MNVPNMISGLRIVLSPLFVYYYMAGSLKKAAAVLVICAVSDMLDGMIARRFNMITRLGKILDPVADKLIQAAMMFCISLRLPQIWILLGLHVFRELLLSAVGLYVIHCTGQVCSAKWYGKLCTAVIYVSMLLLLVLPDMQPELTMLLLFLCSALVLMCLILYLADYLRILRKRSVT